MTMSAEELYYEELIDTDEVCFYCGSPFKECDTVIPGVGVIVGDVDVAEYFSHYWHSGCIDDWTKELY
jgi:hypothetical protein